MMRLRWLVCCLVAVCVSPALAEQVELREHINAIIDQLNDPDNLARLSTGDQIPELGVEALPLLVESLDHKDLSWVAQVAIRGGIEKLQAAQAQQPLPPRVQKKLDWYRLHMVEAYKQFGHRDPKWDDQIIEALDLFARQRAGDPTYHDKLGYERDRMVQRAMKSGCRDPLVHHLIVTWYRVIYYASNAKRQEYDDLASEGLEKHPYHPAFQISIMNMRNFQRLDKDKKLTDPAAREVQQQLNDRIVELLPQLLADRDIPKRLLLDICENVVTSHKRINEDRPAALEMLAPRLQEGLNNESLFHTLQASVLTTAAWDARGGAWAHKVQEEAWAVFRERLKQAYASAINGWKADIENPLPPTEMIPICMGLSLPRRTMEHAFYHAMRNDPDNLIACELKFAYLKPRWQGSAEEMIQFGRQCLLTGNWGARLPDVLLDAHEHLAMYTVDGRLLKEADPDYYARPGVWEDVVAVCEGHLKRHPTNCYMSQRYAKAAISAKQWNIAHRELSRSGDYPDYRVFWLDKKEFDELKAKVAAHANIPI